MKLLIDCLEEGSAYLRDRKELLIKLEAQYRRVADNDIKTEIAEIKRGMAKKKAEMKEEILLHLEEFRYLKSYFPGLLEVLLEDPLVGKIVSDKSWLLHFKPLTKEQAGITLAQIRAQRVQLREARKFVIKWAGRVKSKTLVQKYPALKGHIQGDLDRDDVLEAIKKADLGLRRQGWLVLINDSLIGLPLGKFMHKLAEARHSEAKALEDHLRSQGKGTFAEVNSLRNAQRAQKKREHYEAVLRQILLANPSYLRELKKKKHWLAREKKDPLQRFAETVTPHSVREKAWMNEMKKRLAADDR